MSSSIGIGQAPSTHSVANAGIQTEDVKGTGGVCDKYVFVFFEQYWILAKRSMKCRLVMSNTANEEQVL